MLKRLNIFAFLLVIAFSGFAQESTIYDFRDGSIITNGESTDGKLSLSGNYSHHSANYGLNIKENSEISIEVDGSCKISFLGSVHSSLAMMGTAVTDGDLGTKDAKVASDCVDYFEFAYSGSSETLVFKAVKNSDGGGSDIYLPLIEITPIIETEFPTNGKIDVWDFGAAQLDANLYNNHLSEAVINGFYEESITPGTNNVVFSSAWSAHRLSWKGGSNDRLRTTNTNLTRYDQNIASVSGYTGRVYVNGAAATGRYMSLVLNEDDIVTYIIKTDAGGTMVFENEISSEIQKEEVAVTSDLTELKFVAKEAGNYKIYDKVGKPSYYRIYREDAKYVTLTGNVDISNATGIASTFEIEFENQNGKTWVAQVQNETYSIKLPIGYEYEITLKDLNGFIITSGNSVNIANETVTTQDITVESVALVTLSGAIIGVDANIDNLEIVFTPTNEANTFIPTITIDKSAKTYSTQLEPNVEYAVVANGVNDYNISTSSINVSSSGTQDLSFALKTLYNVTIVADQLTQAQKDELSLTFTNLNEAGYSYTFSDISNVKLRNGVYQVSYSGLDSYAVGLKLTSNLSVLDADTSKELHFEAITNWPFDDKVITSSTPAYKGLLFSGNIANEINKGHLTAKANATIQIPVSVGQKVVFTYYYAADFSVEGGDAFTTNSGSTGTLEYAEYLYAGEADGYVTATIGSSVGTTYIVNIATKNVVAYQENIYVGADKQYQTINEALNAVRNMVRPSNERVAIIVDPGNYEEMLVIDVPNLTIKNSSSTPSIALKDSGVNIDENAVRITSYYGVGYNYYSMANNQKWDAQVLNVNKENGYISYENKSGTTNGSYWNATVVVTASGFVAENLIFENSFNQYISQKESEDVLVLWESGHKGVRPTNVGNTSVQDKSFVERAAAFAVVNNVDKTIINNCRMVGHQDTFFGGINSRVALYKGAIMGGTDYIFGGMVATFYQTDLVLLTSDASSDVAYITAAQQSSGRGYLMYECNIVSAVPGVDNAATNSSKPGYFGRPWQGNTSEVVFYNTNIAASTHPSYLNKSLINPVGWNSSLGGESPFMYEYGTIEESGINNLNDRASWSTILTENKLTDGTEITLFNFTKGNDGWNPFEDLIKNDPSTSINKVEKENYLNVYSVGSTVWVKNITEKTNISVYNLSGMEVKSLTANTDASFALESGVWIVKTSSSTVETFKIIVK